MQKKKRFQVSNKIKLSKAVRTSLIFIAIFMILIAFLGLISAVSVNTGIIKEKKEVYQYTNRLTSNAKINLKSNQYVKESEISDGQVYLSDLISNIDYSLNYNYLDSKKVDVNYSYKVEAIVKASYTNTRSTYDVLNKVEVLKEEKDLKANSSSLAIKENFNINYEKYHKLIKEFKQTMGMNVDSDLIIRLTVNTNAKINSNEVVNQYVQNYKISLGDKVAIIDDTNAKDDKDTHSTFEEVQLENNQEIKYENIVISVVFIILGLILLRLVVSKTEDLRIIRNEFKLELNRILKSYEDKIVEIQDLKQIDVEHATKVKDILQLRKLAEEALVPIYCYVKDDKEAYFIVTKYENSYIFILK